MDIVREIDWARRIYLLLFYDKGNVVFHVEKTKKRIVFLREGLLLLYGIIDIGSNTIRMTIYQVEHLKSRVLLHKKDATGLVSYRENGKLSEMGINKACYVLSGYRSILDNFHIEQKYAFATAAFRHISNTIEALDEIEMRTGLKIEVISGEEEGKMSFIGANRLHGLSNGMLIDIGGGSTELVIYQAGKFQKAMSLSIGSLNAYQEYVGDLHPTKAEKKKIEQAVLTQLAQSNDQDFQQGVYELGCGVGGTVRAVSKLKQDLIQDAGLYNELKAVDVETVTEYLMQEKDKAPRQVLDVIAKIAPYRMRTLMPGLIILNTLLKHYHNDRLKVSMSGVREGYLYSKVLK